MYLISFGTNRSCWSSVSFNTLHTESSSDYSQLVKVFGDERGSSKFWQRL